MLILSEKQGCIRMAQVVKTDTRQASLREQLSDVASNSLRVQWKAASAGEDEITVALRRSHSQTSLILTNSLLPENRDRLVPQRHVAT